MGNYSEFRSRKAVARCDDETFFKLVTDFRNIERFIKLDEWQASQSQCSFSVSPAGKVTAEVVTSIPNSKVTVKGNSSLTGVVDLTVDIEPAGPQSCSVTINMGLELSPFLRIAFGGQIESLLDRLASEIEDFRFS